MLSILLLCTILVSHTLQESFKVEAFFDFSLATVVAQRNDSPCMLLKTVAFSMDDSEAETVLSCMQTTQEFLIERGLDPVEYEYEESELIDGQVLSVRRVTKTRRLVWQSIPYNREETYSNKVPHRKRVYTQGGKNGTMGIVIETMTYTNGKKKEVIVEKWREKEPISEVVTIGSKYRMQKTVVKGTTVYYWKKLTVVATSYDKNCLGCNEWTATGAKLTKGIIAVDPRVIPLHTRMYVPGYGFGKAEDVGGAVKGNKIDLGFDDLRYGDWSKRTVTIYIID
jgi:3D (Asp-Asp-Asp) domain-containing protein